MTAAHPGADPAWTAIDSTLDDLLGEPEGYRREADFAAELHRSGLRYQVPGTGVSVEPRECVLPDVLLWSGHNGRRVVTVCCALYPRHLPWQVSIAHYDGARVASHYRAEGSTLTRAAEDVLQRQDEGACDLGGVL